MGELFEIQNTLSFNKDKLVDGNDFDYVTRTSQNQGILQETGFVNEENINPAGTWSLGLLQMDFFYREKPWYAGQFVRKIVPKIELNKISKPKLFLAWLGACLVFSSFCSCWCHVAFLHVSLVKIPTLLAICKLRKMPTYGRRLATML